MFRTLILMAGFLVLGFSAAAEQAVTIGGIPPAEAMRLGERMYREGLLPSGEPMQALVQIDIPVEGTMFTCDNCHLQSGLGTTEGTIITLPTNGAKLYRTLRHGAEIETNPARAQLAKPFQGRDMRPAYTDETLADALWNGVSPTGREFDWTMPRYLLEDDAMEILVYYLKNLSAEFSPGVTETEIRYATVVAEGVPQAEREAMLLTLQAAIKDRNAQSRHQESRAQKGPFYKQEKYTTYRRTVLDVWELRGPRDTWRQQLENYYRQQPVFGLLGGIVVGDWSPVHGFCEDNEIPSVFPITDQPVVADADWYTLYFSKGHYQEGEAAARYVGNLDLPPDTAVVQVFTTDPASRLFAEGFRETLERLGGTLTGDLLIEEEHANQASFWDQLVQEYPHALFALWSGADTPLHVPRLVDAASGAAAVILSATQSKEQISDLPPSARGRVYLTYPHRLPKPKAGIEKTVATWLKTRKIPVTDMEIQAKMYFLGWMLTGVTRMMGDDFYRDYFLDIFDMMHDENYAIANYPRVSFGPGQRYASKGCYIVRIDEQAPGKISPLTNWVIF